MSRYVDADALECDTEWSEYHDGFTAYSQMAIDTAPSIDIVFCKECKFWIGHISDDDGFDEGLDECRWRDSEAPDADDFCSYGQKERASDEI